MNNINVLIACEESQAVCTAFRDLGFIAFSCDIQECSGGHPEWHIQGDVISLLNGNCEFKTVDGISHYIEGEWDLIIAHPPCQKLSNAGAVNLGRKGCACETPEWREKFFNDRTEAVIFFMRFLSCKCNRVCVENPVGYMNKMYLSPDQCVEPFEYGDPWKKKTCFWLKNLPKLTPTNVVTPTGKWVQQNRTGMKPREEAWECVGVTSAKDRSKTFPGIAKAMAEQWGKYVWYQKYGGKS